MPKELNRPEEGYEKRDMHVSVVFVFAAIVVSMVLGALLITLPIMDGYLAKLQPMTTGLSEPSESLTASQISRGPALQAMPEAEREAIELPDNELLHSYGEVAGAPGKLHIPIEEAIGLLAAGAAPYKAEAPNSPSLTPAPGTQAESSGEAGA